MALAAAVGEGADIARLHELMALIGEAADPPMAKRLPMPTPARR